MKRNGDWIQTYTGKRFWPLDPRSEDIDIVDIGHALAFTCRYAGHSNFYYSVAQHSVLVSENVSKENTLWGLLHDSAEAYIGDFPSPIKQYFPSVKQVENNILRVIIKKCGLKWPEPEEVKRIDSAILASEMKVLMKSPITPWRLPERPLDIEIQEEPIPMSCAVFLATFQKLHMKNACIET